MHNVDNWTGRGGLKIQRITTWTHRCNYLLQILFRQMYSYLCKRSRVLLSICLNRDRLCLTASIWFIRVPRILDPPASTLHSQGQIEGWKEKENEITFVSNYFPWIWHPSINWYSTHPYHFKMPRTISPRIKLIKLWPKETLELKNKLNLPRPRALEKLILPGWACWRLMLLVEVPVLCPSAGWLGMASLHTHVHNPRTTPSARN